MHQRWTLRPAFRAIGGNPEFVQFRSVYERAKHILPHIFNSVELRN
jgi:hypothetical protein